MYASLQELWIENQKCDNADDDDTDDDDDDYAGVMMPMCRPCFAGDNKVSEYDQEIPQSHSADQPMPQ